MEEGRESSVRDIQIGRLPPLRFLADQEPKERAGPGMELADHGRRVVNGSQGGDGAPE